MNVFQKALIAAIKNDEKNHTVYDFNLRYVIVKHGDGSEFKITHAKLEKIKVSRGKGKHEHDCIIVYHEHGCHNLFVESDIESVEVKPLKGRKYKLKLAKI